MIFVVTDKIMWMRKKKLHNFALKKFIFSIRLTISFIYHIISKHSISRGRAVGSSSGS